MNNKKIVLLITCSLIGSFSWSQQVFHLNPENSCFLTDACPGENMDIQRRPASKQAIGFVKQITDQVALTPSFDIYAADDLKGKVACAYIDGQTRIIFVDERAIEKIDKDRESSWPEIYTIAHECAHQLNFDQKGRSSNRHEVELRADRFAGYVLYKLGATRYQTLLTLRSLKNNNCDSHPPIQKRIDAAGEGWEKSYNEGLGRAPVSGKPVNAKIEERYDLVKDLFSIKVKKNPVDRYARWELIHNYIPISFSVENYVVRNNLTPNHTFNVQLSVYGNKPVIWFNAFISCNCIADIEVSSGTVVNGSPQTFRLGNFRKITAQGVVSGQCMGMSNTYFAGGWAGRITLSVDDVGNLLIGNMVLEAYRSADRFSTRAVSYRYTAQNITSPIRFEDKP